MTRTFISVGRTRPGGISPWVLAQSAGDQVVIEPQVPTYWPRIPPLDDSDVLVLSRFAYLRRRGHEIVLESPRAGVLIRVSDPQIMAAITRLPTPQQIRTFRTGSAFTGLELLALLVDCQILFKTDPARLVASDDRLDAITEIWLHFPLAVCKACVDPWHGITTQKIADPRSGKSEPRRFVPSNGESRH